MGFEGFTSFCVRNNFYRCVQCDLLLENYCNSLLVVELLIFCKNSYPIGFDMDFTDAEATLKQNSDNVESTSFRHRFKVGHTWYQRGATLKI